MKKIVVIIFVWCTTVTLYAHTEIKIEKLSQHDYHEVIDICQQLQQAGYNLEEVFDREKTLIGDGVFGVSMLAGSIGLIALCSVGFLVFCCKIACERCFACNEEAETLL